MTHPCNTQSPYMDGGRRWVRVWLQQRVRSSQSRASAPAPLHTCVHTCPRATGCVKSGLRKKLQHRTAVCGNHHARAVSCMCRYAAEERVPRRELPGGGRSAPLQRFHFGQGCLHGHSLAGEEAFRLEWDKSDDSVWCVERVEQLMPPTRR
eukprot:362716-Chlamydomonas_euryale.AAC.10